MRDPTRDQIHHFSISAHLCSLAIDLVSTQFQHIEVVRDVHALPHILVNKNDGFAAVLHPCEELIDLL